MLPTYHNTTKPFTVMSQPLHTSAAAQSPAKASPVWLHLLRELSLPNVAADSTVGQRYLLVSPHLSHWFLFSHDICSDVQGGF